MRYRIWDKQSPVNGVPAEKFLSMMGYTPEQEVYIIENDDGTAWIVQTFENSPYAGQTIEEKAQAHLDALLGEVPISQLESLQAYYERTQEVMNNAG